MNFKTCFFIPTTLTLLLAACNPYQVTPSRLNDAFSENLPKKPAIAPKLPTHTATPLADYKPAKKFFNVSVHNIEAREFFMGLVMDSNENIVVHPEVSGVLSLELKNVTLADVIDVVEKVYGYECEKTDIGYIVYPATLHTRTFKVNHLDVLREGRSNTSVTSGQNSTNNYGTNQGYNNQGYGNQQGAFAQQQGSNLQNNNQQVNNNYNQANQPSGSSVKTSSNTDFWKELNETLHSIIAVDSHASVSINQQSGVVTARAKPTQLHEIENFLGATQDQIGRQVILEAKIIEVILDDSHQDGVNWKVLAQNTANVLTGFGTANAATFTAIFTKGDFTAMVELLSTQGKTNVLSSPKISTLNNQNAIIKVGRDEYFVTGFSSSSNTSIVGTTNSNSLPTPIMASFFSGIALNVTPQIDDNENVTLYIHPAITRVENLEKEVTVPAQDTGLGGVLSQQSYKFPSPLNTVRESDSIVKAQNGQVVVLGGLMQETSAENKEGITGLASIPYIGHLFRVDEGKTQKSELVILLKASIIDEPLDWKNNVDSSRQRYEQLNNQQRWQ